MMMWTRWVGRGGKRGTKGRGRGSWIVFGGIWDMDSKGVVVLLNIAPCSFIFSLLFGFSHFAIYPFASLFDSGIRILI